MTFVSSLIVNCRKMPFSTTAGVAHFLIELAEALAKRHELTFVMEEPEIAVLKDTEAGTRVARIATHVLSVAEAAQGRKDRLDDSIELLPHQFQHSEFCDRSIIVCHDLHVFDVPWKYGDRLRSLQRSLRSNLTNANAVVTEFPRTYYEVEKVADIVVPNLFLTEAPLLFDSSPAFAADGPTTSGRLLYPAQLQDHKNHLRLIDAVSVLQSKGRSVHIDCPGPGFSADLTESILAYAAEHGVADNFNFMGRVSDEQLIELYASCQAVVVASAAEGGAAVALEGIAAGKPVAANAIGSATAHARSVQAEVHWFDAESVDDTVGALTAMVDADHDDWRQRNAPCRQRLANMTWDDVARKWDRFIEFVEGGARPTALIDHAGSEISYE